VSILGLPSGENTRVMSTALIAAIRESGGYLQDEGWHQTAQLMTLAADEIERLSARVRELEARSGAAREIPAGEMRALIAIVSSRSR
jgi:hypothetical protein